MNASTRKKTPEFRKLTLADLIHLEDIGIKIVNSTTGALAELSMNSIVALIYVMSTPSKKMLAFQTHTADGAAKLKSEIAEFSAAVPLEEIEPLANGMVSHLKQSLSQTKSA